MQVDLKTFLIACIKKLQEIEMTEIMFPRGPTNEWVNKKIFK